MNFFDPQPYGLRNAQLTYGPKNQIDIKEPGKKNLPETL